MTSEDRIRKKNWGKVEHADNVHFPPCPQYFLLAFRDKSNNFFFTFDTLSNNHVFFYFNPFPNDEF